MPAAKSDCINTLSVITVYLYQYFGISLYIIGNIGNVLCLLIFLQRSWRKNVCVFYFIVCVVNNIIFINSALIGDIFVNGFHIRAHNYSIIVCKLFYYISFVSSGYFAILLIFASVDRLLISSLDVDTRLYSSKRLAYLFVSSSMLFWGVFSLHIPIKVNIHRYDASISVCYFDLSQNYLNFFVYSLILIAIGIPIVLIVLSIITFKNVHQNRINRNQQRHQIRSMHKKDFQLLRCLYVHNIVYIVFSILLAVGIVYDTMMKFQAQLPVDEAVNAFLAAIGSLLHYIPFCLNCFIFFGWSKTFRMEMKQMIKKIFGVSVTTEHGEENNQEFPIRDIATVKPVANTSVLGPV